MTSLTIIHPLSANMVMYYTFANKTELLAHAKTFVSNRVNSLESDAKHCLPEDSKDNRIAPFPIMLYCFATINLLGALMGGQANKKAPTTEQSIQYMTNLMCYSTENATIFIDLYRHKLVHLAQPKPLIRYGSEVMTSVYHHNDRNFHLRKEPHQQGAEIGDVPLDWHIPVTHEFHISIMDLVIDIKDSAVKPNGYLDLLEKSAYMQHKYETAINHVYSE